MENNAYWDVFTETGDPVCWLLSRESGQSGRQEDAAEVPGTVNGTRRPDKCTATRSPLCQQL